MVKKAKTQEIVNHHFFLTVIAIVMIVAVVALVIVLSTQPQGSGLTGQVIISQRPMG